MRRALLIDTETTGLNPEVDKVIEVGACLYDLELGCPIESYAALLRYESNSNAAEHVNRIPVAALDGAREARLVWQQLEMIGIAADVVAAHRASFDQPFVESSGFIQGRTWVCTKTDFDWPGVGRGDHLVHLALAYGLGVASAHRAAADVDMMARILTRIHELGHSLPELFKRAARPKKRFVAMVSYEMRQTAKDAGFLWSPETKEWVRQMPSEDAEALPFRVVQRDA
jgi:DNA polymerase-3 subunit epsilon